MDSCEPDGYRCECDDKHFGKRCEHEISKYIRCIGWFHCSFIDAT